MFVLLRIRKGCSIIKDWYGVKRACENLTFASSGMAHWTAETKFLDRYLRMSAGPNQSASRLAV